MSDFQYLAWLTDVSALMALFLEGATTSSGPATFKALISSFIDLSQPVLTQTTRNFFRI